MKLKLVKTIPLLVFLIFCVMQKNFANTSKEIVEKKIQNLKTTPEIQLEDSIEILIYYLHKFKHSYGYQVLIDLENDTLLKSPRAKLRIKHGLAEFNNENQYQLIEQALSYARENNIETYYIDYYTTKANWFYTDQMFDSSIVSLLEARKYTTKLNMTKNVQIAHMLGDLFYSLDLYQLAEENYQTARSLIKNPKINEKWEVIVLENNLALINIKKGNYAEAKATFENAKKLIGSKIDNYQDSIALSYYNRKIAECICNLKQEITTGINLVEYTYRITKKYQITDQLIPTYFILIRLYIQNEDTKQILKYYTEFKEYIKENKISLEHQRDFQLLSADVYEYLGEIDQAILSYKNYKDLTEQIALQEKTASIISMLTNQDYTKLETNLNQVEKQRLYLISIIVLVLLLVAILINRMLQISKLNNELVLSNNTKDKLFSIISHDLKSPFNTILGFSKLSIEAIDAEDFNDVKKFNQFVFKKSNELLQLINNLLNWSRTQQKRIQIQAKNENFFDILNEVKPIIELQANEKQIQLCYEIDEQLTCFADRFMMSTVLTNLVSNAIKFSYPNTIVTIRAKQAVDKAEILIIDHGVGMSDEKQKNVFTINNNTISSVGTNNEKGTGLGLIVCDEFIAQNKGSISIKSQEGVGTTIKIMLPTC